MFTAFPSRFEIHVFLHNADTAGLTEISRKLDTLIRKEEVMSQELDDLTEKVTANGDVEKSAVVLLQGLKAALDAAGTDPVKLRELSTSLGSQSDELAAAVTANTPAAPSA